MIAKTPLAVLEDELVQEGYLEGTPAYVRGLLQKKVQYCQQDKGVLDCRECAYFDHCETAKAYLVDLKYNRVLPVEQAVTVTDRLPDWMFVGSRGHVEHR